MLLLRVFIHIIVSSHNPPPPLFHTIRVDLLIKADQPSDRPYWISVASQYRKGGFLLDVIFLGFSSFLGFSCFFGCKGGCAWGGVCHATAHLNHARPSLTCATQAKQQKNQHQVNIQ